MITDDIKAVVREIYEAIDDKKGEDITVINISELSIIADYFVIASANSDRQAKAIATEVQKRLAEKGVFPIGKEGLSSPSWILLDYGDVMVHIFRSEERYFYDLERTWKDGQREEIEKF